jgi:fructokinase
VTHALVVGEALIDVVAGADGDAAEHPGGSPANVALGLARLGREAQLATWFGRDERGATLERHLRDAGVDLVPGSDAAERTSTATATLDETGAASYTFDLSWDVPEVHLDDDVAVVHVGSIAATLLPGGDAVAEIAASARSYATVSYDPNARPTIMGTPVEAEPLIERVAAVADVVKVSDEDFAWLYPHTEPRDAARQWVRQGPLLVVVTSGGEGSFAVTATGVEVEVPAPSVTVADTVGAGDSYTAGLLDALWTAGLLGADRRAALREIDEATLRTAMEWAARIAAITVSRPGADPPTRDQLEVAR